MAKEGIYFDKIQPILKRQNDYNGWSLCVGAGVSYPLFPSWHELAGKLAVNIDDKVTVNKMGLENYGFSADAIIQAVQNKYFLSDNAFSKYLIDTLYADFKESMKPSEWSAYIKLQDSKTISTISHKTWEEFIDYRNTNLYKIAANDLAITIANSIKAGIQPENILSFNAESLLYVLINSYIMEPNLHKPGQKSWIKIDHMENGFSKHQNGRIPYIHCHGFLPCDSNKKRSYSNKLIFSEESYLELANNAFSWQATTFINTCLNDRVVFVGVSLTDSNMRRWLNWAHSYKININKSYGNSSSNTAQHFWIKKIPDIPEQISWIEAAVAHLGIRLIWIDSWDQAGMVLNKLIGL